MTPEEEEKRRIRDSFAAFTVANDPTVKNKMQGGGSTPIQPIAGVSPEIEGSSFLGNIRPPAVPVDDGLGEFGPPPVPQQQIRPQYQQPTAPQANPAQAQSVIDINLQGAILRRLASIEKSNSVLIDKLMALQDTLKVWEERIQFDKSED